MQLSVIIVNWNVRDYLRECLRSLIANIRLSREQFEIIVVDNASEDGSVDMIRTEFPDVILIAGDENLGFGKGCNKGYEVSSGKYVFLLNPDTVIQSDSIGILIEEMEHNEDLGVIGCRLVDERGDFRPSSAGYFPTLRNLAWNYLFFKDLLPSSLRPNPHFIEDDFQGRFDIQWVSGADMLIRRDAIGVKIFDEAFFMYGEDMDFCNRIALDGWKVVYTTATSILHHHGRSFQKQSSVAVLQNLHKGPRLFFQKNHSRFATAIYDLILLAGFLIRWPAYRIASWIRPGGDSAELARFSRQYVMLMLSLFLNSMKYKLLNLLRSLGILRFSDSVKFWSSRVLFLRSNSRFIEAHPDFPVPPYSLAFDAFNTIDWNAYHDIGLLHAEVFADIIKKNCVDHELNLLEWGCGPGRIIRHISRLLRGYNLSITGTDYNQETIAWCSKHLPGINFVENELLPPMLFYDNEFDVAYNFSVLTHLSEESQKAWIGELWRILKPGGLLICTTHGDQYTHLLTKPEEHRAFEQGKVVVQGQYTEGKKWFLSIHPERFVKESLLKTFTEIQRVPVAEKAQLQQDVWIAKKPVSNSDIPNMAG